MTQDDSSALPARPELTVVPVAELEVAGKSAIVHLCTEALGPGGRFLFEYLSASTHVLAHIDGRLVGHACWTLRRLQPEGLPALRTAWVDAVCTSPPLQNGGIGTLVMRRVADLVAHHELAGLGTERVSFYERLGWELWHGPTEGVLHDPLDSLMIRRTAATPQIDTRAAITAT
jgi:GNAT superfamily N-acetyltransferase